MNIKQRKKYEEIIIPYIKREIYEECGFRVELTGVCQIGSWKLVDNIAIGIIFSAKIVGGEINFNPDEILDAKWFTYDEILAMKSELRSADFLICFDEKSGFFANGALLSYIAADPQFLLLSACHVWLRKDNHLQTVQALPHFRF